MFRKSLTNLVSISLVALAITACGRIPQTTLGVAPKDLKHVFKTMYDATTKTLRVVALPTDGQQYLALTPTSFYQAEGKRFDEDGKAELFSPAPAYVTKVQLEEYKKEVVIEFKDDQGKTHKFVVPTASPLHCEESATEFTPGDTVRMSWKGEANQAEERVHLGFRFAAPSISTLLLNFKGFEVFSDKDDPQVEAMQLRRPVDLSAFLTKMTEKTADFEKTTKEGDSVKVWPLTFEFTRELGYVSKDRVFQAESRYMAGCKPITWNKK